MTPAGRRASQAGFSFIEVTVASVMLLALAYLVATLSISGMDAQKYSERMARVTEITQDMVDEMRNGLASSVRLFSDDALGTAYFGIIDTSNLQAPTASGKLPKLSPNGLIEKDTVGAEKTGNTLFFARFAWTDEFSVTSGTVYRIDVYRMECFYLSSDGGGPKAGEPDGLNLCHWVGEPLADGSQVDGISDPIDQAEVLLHLSSRTPDINGVVHDQVELVWKVGDDPTVAGTLRQIDSTGGMSNSPLSPRSSGWEILPEVSMSRTMLYYRHHSVISNYAPPVMGVGRFGIIDNSGEGFPHGLEIQIVGPASARQVLLHLTVVSTNRKGHRAYQDMQVVADTRDL